MAGTHSHSNAHPQVNEPELSLPPTYGVFQN